MDSVVPVPVRLRWALLIGLLYHGGLLLFRSHERTYDAFVHIFLADHYRRDWFSTWDQRWYTGFTTVSYPPGTHMATAAVSKVLGDLELGYMAVQLAVLLSGIVAVYRFSCIWVDREAAANASMLFVLASSIAETVHLFGQLPTTWALSFLLHALPYHHRWLREGRKADLISGTGLLAACTAGHHVTTLFGSVFFLGPIIAWELSAQSRMPVPDEPRPPPTPRWSHRTALALAARRVRRAGPACVRTAILVVAVVTVLVVVVFPYWLWSSTDPISQIPIPHGSRENFLVEGDIGLVFFVIPWGLAIFALPYALGRAVLDRKWPLAASLGLLTVLGTGGTTPIPRMLLGGAFDILTLDRFTFWATILVLPMAGQLVAGVEHGSIAVWLRTTGGRALLTVVQVVGVAGLAAFSIFAATLTQYRPFQPERIDTEPIVDFITKDQHERWRYLTLGFGDQVAWLSAQTTATQVDGNYHSARRLPELTSTPVERLEGAKYRGVAGLGSLQQFLEVPEKYHLKFVFSNDPFYDPLLDVAGWQRVGPLENGIMVWERADVAPLPAILPVRELPPWQRMMWGVIPPLAVVAAAGIGLWNVLGRPGLDPAFDTEEANRRILVGPFDWTDRMLHRMQAGLADDGSDGEDPVSGLATLGERLRHRMRSPITRRRRILRLTVLAAAVAVPAGLAAWSVQEEPTPTAVVESYFDHLDFRRWAEAYELLDPMTRPDFELWRLQQSVNGGILASYAKLEALETALVELDDRRAVVRADLVYLTALDRYPVTRVVKLNRGDGGWGVEPLPTDPTLPPEQLVRTADVDYVVQGRRRVTSETTELFDVQDRPELDIVSVEIRTVDNHPIIVGEITNVDVDPADITITGILRREDGSVVGRYNATETARLTLLPRESTPFLVAFEEVAATDDVEFDPLNFVPLTVDEDIASAEVSVKGVVTDRNLYRGLGLASADIVRDEDGAYHLSGVLANSGVAEVTIPRVLISFLDHDGRPLWVQTHYLEYSIRPRRSREFTVALDDISAVEAVDVPVRTFDNALQAGDIETSLEPPDLMVPEGLPYAGIRIGLAGFVAEDR